jgi:guanylate kinase
MIAHKRIILVGPGASGKDHMRKVLESRGFKYAVSYTTRPARPGEVEGKDYYFLSPEICRSMQAGGKFYELIDFNGWSYGTTNEQFQTDDIFIMTPTGLSHLSAEERKTSFVIFFDIDETIRKERLEQRVMPGHSVEARLQADRELFEGFNDYDLRITNPDF